MAIRLPQVLAKKARRKVEVNNTCFPYHMGNLPADLLPRFDLHVIGLRKRKRMSAFINGVDKAVKSDKF